MWNAHIQTQTNTTTQSKSTKEGERVEEPGRRPGWSARTASEQCGQGERNTVARPVGSYTTQRITHGATPNPNLDPEATLHTALLKLLLVNIAAVHDAVADLLSEPAHYLTLCLIPSPKPYHLIWEGEREVKI